MYNYCKTCCHDDGDIGFCDKCYHNHILEEKGIPPTEYEAKPKPITNGDRIRRMTDEELAEFMNRGACPPGKDSLTCIDEEYAHGRGPYVPPEKCHKCWLDCLRKEEASDETD